MNRPPIGIFGVRFGVIWGVGAAIAVGVLLALIPVSAQAASAGNLCLYGSDENTNTGILMAAGTNPAIAQYPGGGTEVAFQDSSDQLATYLDSTNSEDATGYGMDPVTSPAITSSGSTVSVAMTANNDELYIGDGSSMSATGQLVNAGTSPAVAALSSSSDEYVYNGANGLISGDGTNWTDQQFGPEAGTSPSITAVSGSWEAADQANTSAMWVHGDGTGYSSGDGMNTSTSPSIAAVATSGDFEMAFEANTNELWVVAGQAGEQIYGASTGEAMAPGTDPSVAAYGAGTDFEIAYQGANGDLWVYGNAGSADTGQAMAPGTSPSITQTAQGYEVAYQCVAPPPPVTTTTTVVVTTTVQSSSPTPRPTGTGKAGPKINALFKVAATWNGAVTHISRVTTARKLPAGAIVSFRCTAGLKAKPCPRLGAFPKTRRTLARELAVVADRSYPQDNALAITIFAKKHTTEILTVKLTGAKPSWSRRWK